MNPIIGASLVDHKLIRFQAGVASASAASAEASATEAKETDSRGRHGLRNRRSRDVPVRSPCLPVSLRSRRLQPRIQLLTGRIFNIATVFIPTFWTQTLRQFPKIPLALKTDRKQQRVVGVQSSFIYTLWVVYVSLRYPKRTLLPQHMAHAFCAKAKSIYWHFRVFRVACFNSIVDVSALRLVERKKLSMDSTRIFNYLTLPVFAMRAFGSVHN